MSYDLILRGDRVIDASQKLDAATDVAFSGGKVAQIGPALKADAETDVRDLSGFIVAPGLIDLHTHVYWGGTSLGIDRSSSRQRQWPAQRPALDRADRRAPSIHQPHRSRSPARKALIRCGRRSAFPWLFPNR